MNIFPLIYSLFLSFTEYSVISSDPPVWVGLENYTNILNDPQFWHYFGVTGTYALISVALQTLVGFGLAMLLRTKFTGSGVVTTLILVPMMLSPIVVAVFWRLIFNPSYGIFNYIFGFLTLLLPALIGVILVLLLWRVVPRLIGESSARYGRIALLILIPVAAHLFWRFVLNQDQTYGDFFARVTAIETGPEWLAEPVLAMWAIIIVDVWMWSPFVMLLCLAGLSAIPEYLYEAAAIDRASGWFQFRRITLPQVMPLLLIAVLFRTIEAFKQFDLVMGLTGGGPGDVTRTVSVQLYQLAFQGQFNTGQSSALAYIVLVIIIAVSNLYIRALNRAREG
ncbi:MAG: sugar ABC transporter permease [Chloroflexi bacterium]|nr:sugar ABC transporter permease [Chloroflexota bacterium]MBN8451481.1 sugar ABC transporter permease [Accumulibacter sp.]